ncbi:hypothetical protein [Vibrio sp.]|uniref:hypothetical protein n=1 Tax=Vibrio sp. TaxID=678 RepID=UPI003F6BE4F4
MLKLTGFDEEYQADTGAKLSFLWDEREHYYYPYHGFLFELTFENHGTWLGNDEDATYSSLFSDYRFFYSLTHRATTDDRLTKENGRCCLAQ